MPDEQALFAGLVFNEADQPAEVGWVGETPCYIVLDMDFRRHVEAHEIDRQVLAWLREQILSNRELVSQGAMSMLGQEDLFTKAMIDASLNDLDTHMAQLMERGLPEELRQWLGILGFRVVVNVHGEVVAIEAPGAVEGEE